MTSTRERKRARERESSPRRRVSIASSFCSLPSPSAQRVSESSRGGWHCINPHLSVITGRGKKAPPGGEEVAERIGLFDSLSLSRLISACWESALFAGRMGEDRARALLVRYEDGVLLLVAAFPPPPRRLLSVLVVVIVSRLFCVAFPALRLSSLRPLLIFLFLNSSHFFLF